MNEYVNKHDNEALRKKKNNIKNRKWRQRNRTQNLDFIQINQSRDKLANI